MVVAGTVVAATEYTEWTETHGLLRVWRRTVAPRARTNVFLQPPLGTSGTSVQKNLGSFLKEFSLNTDCSVLFRPFRVFRGHLEPFRATNPARTLE